MTPENQYKYLVSAYYGVIEMNEYDLKVYVLKEIENHIKEFIKTNPIPNYNYKKEAEIIKDKTELKTKLLDAFYLLNEIDGPLDLRMMIKAKIKSLK